jgi:hypothetical protein
MNGGVPLENTDTDAGEIPVQLIDGGNHHLDYPVTQTRRQTSRSAHMLPQAIMLRHVDDSNLRRPAPIPRASNNHQN